MWYEMTHVGLQHLVKQFHIKDLDPLTSRLKFRKRLEARGVTKQRVKVGFVIETTILLNSNRQNYKDLVRLSLFSCHSERPYPSVNGASF
ncbi:hypothetical protein SDJN03_08956, partial [Cucurbita argyrosperma subsp. sororia]